MICGDVFFPVEHITVSIECGYYLSLGNAILRCAWLSYLVLVMRDAPFRHFYFCNYRDEKI